MPLNEISGNTSEHSANSSFSSSISASTSFSSSIDRTSDRSKPGPKPRSLEQHKLPSGTFVARKKRRGVYSAKVKKEALLHLFHYKITEKRQRFQTNGTPFVFNKLPGQADWVWAEVLDPDSIDSAWVVIRGPTLREAGNFLKIPWRTLGS